MKNKVSAANSDRRCVMSMSSSRDETWDLRSQKVSSSLLILSPENGIVYKVKRSLYAHSWRGAQRSEMVNC